MQGTFKTDNKFEKRVELCRRISKQYPTRVPVIVELAPKTKLKLNRTKFLAPQNISVGGLLNEIRRQSSLQPAQAIFLFCGSTGTLVPTSQTLLQVREKFKDEDGFLYFTVAMENTFGAFQSIEDFSQKCLDGALKTSAKIASKFYL